ncbi:MAG: PAS domain S-box protein, partial [Anaerolineae bacterium]|nr:PAS domain S-box protein [Anaerolineae bacterium]
MTADPPPQHDQEALYKALFEQATDGIFVANRNGFLIEVNPHGCQMLGYTRAEILQLSIDDLIPDGDRETNLLSMAALRNGETVRKESRLCGKDGRLVPVETSARMLANGHFLAIIRDISMRKETENKLRDTTQKLQRVTASVSDYLWSSELDEQGNWSYNYYSPVVEQITGYPPSFYLKNPQRWLSTIHPDDQTRLFAALQRIINGQSMREEEEYRIIRPDGTVRWVRDCVTVTQQESGHMHIDGVVSDITERKQIQQENQSHLWFLESLDRINRTIQGTNDIKQMMSEVLDVILSLFNCDRAWLVYPCDPETDFWEVPMEKTRPEYPGAGALGLKIPLTPEIATIMRLVNASSSPVKFSPKSEHNVPAEIAQNFSVQSMIATTFHPKSDKPWVFGLHQCAYARQWTAAEERLFQEIGHRLADSLTSLLTYRELRESEDRLEEAERVAHVGYWEFDLVQERLILSNETYRIFGLPPQESITDLNVVNNLIHPEDIPAVEQSVAEALQGSDHYGVDYRIIHPNGDTRIVHSRGHVIRDESGQPRRLFGTTQDITERRQANDELCASEARFRTFVDHATDAFFMHDDRGNIVDVNQQACESLGYTREELLGLPLHKFNTEVDQATINKIDAQLNAGEDVTFEAYYRRKDGTRFPVEVRIRSFWQGEHHYGVSLVRDITDRKQAQEELTLFRSLLDNTNDTIEIIDPETGRFLDVNEQACRIHGYTREEFLSLTISKINPGVADWEKTVEELRQSRSIVRENYHRRKDGSHFPVEININYIRLDRDYILAVVRDITERKRAEEALRASEQRYRALYRDNPSMFFTLDAGGTIIAVNEFGASQLGYTIAELEGRPVLDVFYEEDKAAVSKQLKTCLQNPWQVFQWQFRKVRKDGSLIWVEEYVRTVNGSNGVMYVLVVCHDITGRKQLEADNETLTAQFYQAQKMESIGRLAGGIAHDFNNLLVPIMGYAELSLSRVDADSKLYSDLTQVRKAADRAADLTRQILAFSRQQVLELSLLNTNDIIIDFKRMLQRLIGEDIELYTFLVPDLVPIKADKSQIEQVIMNLAVNARDAMPNGGKLIIETANVVLDETYVEKYANELTPGPYIMLAVSDTGHGIDAQTQKRIFDPFFTTKASGHGTGLGLATVFGIIKQHQGHIMVYSEPDNGTTFKTYLPKAKEFGQTVVDQTPEPALKFGTETILVVEDEEMVRKLVCETLETYGYNVIEAKNPADGLNLASTKGPIHLLVTDVIMPYINGKELYQQVSALHPNCKVLYMSGYTNNVIIHHGILDKGINFLQ